MIEAVSKQDCTGCCACGDACPHGAITFADDREGFWYPVVDNAKCVSCGLCLKVCPVYKPFVNALPRLAAPDVYAAWSLTSETRAESTSGGLYSELARPILARSGYIVGSRYTQDYKGAAHVVGNDEQTLLAIRGSRHIQSSMRGVYRQIKALLARGETVLYTGTPCQNAALLSFLGKPYENLILCDFICHGVNSPRAWRCFLEELEEKYHAPVEVAQVKNKRQGWWALGTYVKLKNGREHFRNRYTSAWLQGFIGSDMYLRPSCYHCHFKNMPRISDITLGDYWGRKDSLENMRKGVSVVLVNSEKGRALYQAIQTAIASQPSDFALAVQGNPSLLRSALCSPKREDFFARLGTKPFSKIVWQLTGVSLAKRTIKNMRFHLWRLVGKI